MSELHRWWVTSSVRELRETLARLGQPLVVRCGNPVSVLEDLLSRLGRFTLWSHEETGNGQTYQRDRAILAWCRSRGITWNERRQFGVIRPLKSREHWSHHWEECMSSPLLASPERLLPVPVDLGEIPHRETAFTPTQNHQLPGERAANICLRSFLNLRGEGYSGGISSPITASTFGSRLSPYLAWGNVSLRTVVTQTRARQAELRLLPAPLRGRWLRSLHAFSSRLHWHCHFIQKLESEPEVEYECFIRALNEMRSREGNQSHLIAWQAGATGYPFVDACMRYLRATGWLNFRMRAMLVSFAAYDLFLDWRLFAHFLAQQFLDYEPGIHYAQIQMQSGTTGINTLRMYDPVKQGYDHDPTGEFTRAWVPELAHIPGKLIHEPWNLSPLEQKECGFVPNSTYPSRIVIHSEAVKAARTIIGNFRQRAEVKRLSRQALLKHGSRARRRRSTSSKASMKSPDTQLSLFSPNSTI